MKQHFLALGLALTASAAQALCPPGQDTADSRAALHSALLTADTEAAARAIANQLWEIWLTAPDAAAQDLLDRAMARREAYAYDEAEALLDELIAYCPSYAEGYNQRAFARFLRENYDGSLADLEIVLQSNPYHFGALSGQALNLMRQGRMDLAQNVLRDAVKVHPYLQERAFLIPDDDI